MAMLSRITPCLWFDDQGEAAAQLYTSVFPNSRIVEVSRYTEAGREVHGRPPGSAMTVLFELDGQRFTALNGGPVFRFTEAVSFQVTCADQAEVDHYWTRLGEGGDPAAQRCGWLKDRFGLSWQVIPQQWAAYASDPVKGPKAFAALMEMSKIDLAVIEAAVNA